MDSFHFRQFCRIVRETGTDSNKGTGYEATKTSLRQSPTLYQITKSNKAEVKHINKASRSRHSKSFGSDRMMSFKTSKKKAQRMDGVNMGGDKEPHCLCCSDNS